MPTFNMVAGDHSVFGWDALGGYDVTSDRARKIVLTFSEDAMGRVFDAARDPWQVVLNIRGGEVRNVVWLEEDGDVLARATGIETDAEIVRTFLDPDVNKGWDLYQLMLQDGATFDGIGSDGFTNDIMSSIGDDVVRSNGGNLYAKDRGGADLYIGGSGYDQVTYQEWFWREPAHVIQGIDADLAKGRITGPDGAVDRLRGTFEGVRGTFLDDVMRGDGRDNEFQGMMGDDTINGRGGFDFVSYRQDTDQGGDRGVTVNLARGFGRDGFGDRDRLVSIEGAQGTNGRDTFIDGGADNAYQGRGGNDRFIVKGGDDWLQGEGGADRFIFRGRGFGQDIIDDFDPGDGDRIRIAAARNKRDLEISRDRDDTVIEFGDNSIRLDGFDGRGVDLFDYISF